MKHIDCYLDFISPYAYLAFERLPRALKGRVRLLRSGFQSVGGRLSVRLLVQEVARERARLAKISRISWVRSITRRSVWSVTERICEGLSS